MNIAIVGAGAIGCRIAAHLAQQGTRCTLLDGWAEHVAAMNQEGIRMRQSNAAEVRLPVRAFHYDDAPQERFDLVLLAVRSDATLTVLPLVQHLLADAGAVVSCQNGLNEEEIAQAVGVGRTLGCSMIFGARLTEPGMVEVLPGADTLRLGEMSGEVTPRLRAVAELLSPCGTVSFTPNLLGYRWMKLALNATGNPLLLLSGLTGEELHRREPTRRLIIGLANEVLSVARREGVRPERLLGHDDCAWSALGALDDPALHDSLFSHGISLGSRRLSMVADFEARGGTEVGEITGKVISKASKLGLSVPLNEAVLQAVRALEGGRLAPGLSALQTLETLVSTIALASQDSQAFSGALNAQVPSLPE